MLEEADWLEESGKDDGLLCTLAIMLAICCVVRDIVFVDEAIFGRFQLKPIITMTS